ncbi:MAG: HupE/UreJ family protein [Pseudomonadota bacterium]
MQARAAVPLTMLCCAMGQALAHGVADGDAAFIAQSAGPHIVPFMYLGAKHMVTGYDHLLFLLGVIYCLEHMRAVALYVTLFAAGHSVTLLSGVLGGFSVSPWLIDAIIGLSVAYKAFDNLDSFRTVFGVAPNRKWAVFIFGLFHGLGLAGKLQELQLSPHGLLVNLLAFHVGIELGQLCALALMLALLAALRRGAAQRPGRALAVNTLLMAAGFVLAACQLSGYFLQQGIA